MAHHRFGIGGSVELPSFNFTPTSRSLDDLSGPTWEESALSNYNENTLPPRGSGPPVPSTPERPSRGGQRYNSVQFEFSPPRHTFGSSSFPSARLNSSFSISQSAPSGAGFGEHNPLARFYHDSEQPWALIASDAAPPSRRSGALELGRPNFDVRNYRSAPQTELESTDTGFLDSQSGYHTYSVKSTEPTEYSQDIGAQFAEQFNNSLQPFYPNMSSLPTPNSDRSEGQQLARTLSSRGKGPLEKCPLCDITPKCPSDFKKHMLKHSKPHRCEIAGCNRTQGFTTVNDLIRHQKSVHKLDIKGKTKSYKCAARDCRNPDKEWPRLDNFKQHIIRMHPNEDVQELIDRSELKDSLTADLSLDNTLAGMDPTSSGYDEEEEAFISPASLAARPDPVPLIQGWNSIQSSNRAESSRDPSAARRTSRSAQTGEARSSTVYSLLSAPAPMPSPVSSRSNATKVSSSGSLSTLADVAMADASRQRTGPGPTSPQLPSFQPQGMPHLNPMGSQDLRALSAMIAMTIRQSRAEDLDEQVFQALRRLGPLGGLPAEPPRRNDEIPARNSSFTAPVQPQLQHESSSSDDDVLSASEAMKGLQSLASLAKKSKGKTSPQARNNQQKICPKCRKVLPRTCDMNKHMKRHTRPYGCTFPKCPKEFGSKNDWKRHENSQHFQIELYRCQIPDSSEKARYGHCAAIFYSRNEFEGHLAEKHQCSRGLIPDRVKEARIGRNNQVRFWCGFCRKIVPLSDQGVAGWDERFNHIDCHFKKGERRDDWVDAEENKTKGEILREIKARKGEDVGDEDDEETETPPSGAATTTDSPSSGSAFSGRVSEIVNSSGSMSDSSRKRKADSDAYQGARAPKGKEFVFFCCQCGSGPHSEKLYSSCLACGHVLEGCGGCTRKAVRAGRVELDVSRY